MSISVDIPIVDGIEVDVSYNLSTNQASFGISEGIAGCDVFVEAANVCDIGGQLQGTCSPRPTPPPPSGHQHWLTAPPPLPHQEPWRLECLPLDSRK
jgi:hypothetical protein